MLHTLVDSIVAAGIRSLSEAKRSTPLAEEQVNDEWTPMPQQGESRDAAHAAVDRSR